MGLGLRRLADLMQALRRPLGGGLQLHGILAGALAGRTQPLGGARSWTSGIAKLDEEVTGVLDLTTDRAGNPGGTLLRVVNTAVFESEMR